MSAPISKKIPRLMELKISPPNGHPELPKWNPTGSYRLKDQYLLNETENPFHIDFNLYNSEEKSSINGAPRRKSLTDIFPKNPPAPEWRESQQTKNHSESRRIQENPPAPECRELQQTKSHSKSRSKSRRIRENPPALECKELQQTKNHSKSRSKSRRIQDNSPALECKELQQTKNHSKSRSKSRRKRSDNKSRDIEIPMRFEKMSESSQITESTSSGSPNSALASYLKIKKDKAFILQKLQEDDLDSLLSSLTTEDLWSINEELQFKEDFKSQQDLYEIGSSPSSDESGFQSHSSITVSNNTSKNGGLDRVVKRLQEYYI